MDYYKENYAEELRAFYLDEKYQNEILSIQREKQRTTERIQLYDKKRQLTRDQITENFNKDQLLQKQKEKLIAELKSKNEEGLYEIVKLETYLDNKTLDLETKPL